MIKRIPKSQYKTALWKNGGGTTHEILRCERDGKMLCRCSVADVETNGPFSIFPGITRILTVFDGAGMDLLPDNAAPLLAAHLRPITFPGELPIHAKLISGPCRDFNVMHDRNETGCTFEVLRGRQAIALAPHGIHVIYCLHPSASTNAGADDTILVTGGGEIEIGGEALHAHIWAHSFDLSSAIVL